ncbi:MAG TPA: TRAP transporter large permease subunit [Gammaproteobacteria bacterium]|nr:TRAP transporter large permease subunit [Gammaproteobacteria bacterium]
MFIVVCLVLMAGFPVAFSLAGTALLFALFGSLMNAFDLITFKTAFLNAGTSRIFGIMQNESLVAVPLFVFMGLVLERSRVAENLLETMAALFGPLRGGLGYSVIIVGTLMAASTGIVGATVVTMGLLSLPTMLRRGYDPAVVTGTICASGTLGQIIPPSIVLILLGDVLTNAANKAGSVQTSVGELFAGALIPGIGLVILYILYLVFMSIRHPDTMPAIPEEERRLRSHKDLLKQVFVALLPPLLLIIAVLGSIIAGLAAPTEAASIGALGAILLAVMQRQFNLDVLRYAMRRTVAITSMVFMIFIGATIFSLVFRGYSGEELVSGMLNDLPGSQFTAILLVMVLMFLLGFILDFIEITFVVVPIVAPVLLTMGVHPTWLGIMIAINLQTSFLTPPFGFSLFYLRSVAPAEVRTEQMYKGVIPFIGIQILMMVALAVWPELATWLPEKIF